MMYLPTDWDTASFVWDRVVRVECDPGTDYAANLVANWPPFTEEQLDRLSRILRTVDG